MGSAPGDAAAGGEFQSARWRPTHAHARTVLITAGGILLALLGGRPDLILLVTPLALVAVWGMVTRPRGRPEARLRLSRTVVRETEESQVVTQIRGIRGADTASSQIPPSPWTLRRPDHGAQTVAVPARTPLAQPERDDGGAAREPGAEFGRESDPPGATGSEDLLPGVAVEIVTGADPARWGVHRVGPGAAGALGPWGSWVWGPVPLEAQTLRAVPVPEAFEASAPAPHPRGLIGRHRSARPGEGAEFDTVRPFRWGDRLRRIHWARSSRSAELHVTSSYADQDTHLALLLDAQEDIDPPDVRADGGEHDAAPSTLDRALRSTAAISEHFVRAGDRVSLQVIPAGRVGRVPPGTGVRQARRILDVLSHVSPAPERSVDFSRLRLGLAPGTLVVLVSALLSEAAGLRAVALARSGLTVVVVDVLGDASEPVTVSAGRGPASPAEDVDPVRQLAWRLRMLERAEQIRRLRRAGVAVVPWRGPGSMDAVLRLLARRGARTSPPGVGR